VVIAAIDARERRNLGVILGEIIGRQILAEVAEQAADEAVLGVADARA
jgi:hypothetical protein